MQGDAKKFWKSAAALGFDKEKTLQALGVPDLAHFAGRIGDALNRLAEAKKQQARGEQQALMILTEEERRALYPSDELAQRGAMLRAFAPWAHGKEPVSDQEIALVVLRCDTMGLDALNPHEIQIWKDKKGRLNFMLSYILTHQFVNDIHGGHLKPRYDLLTNDEKAERGLNAGDKAICCSFIMKRDIPLIAQMMEAGWTAAEARAEITVSGIGTVQAADWDGAYFAPNARDKTFKLEKRAYIAAVRENFGDPSRAQIEQMRRGRAEDLTNPAAWGQAAQITVSPVEQVLLAQAEVQGQVQLDAWNELEPEQQQEKAAVNSRILYGDEDFDGFGDDPEPTAEPGEADIITGEIILDAEADAEADVNVMPTPAPSNGNDKPEKCPVCAATAPLDSEKGHAPFCRMVDGKRVKVKLD